MMMRPNFADLYFGKSDSVHEALERRDEFMRSYVDLDGAVGQVVSGEKTLILGPKGTGKSALGVYIEKGSGEVHFARMRNASSLPLAEIPQLDTGQDPGAARTYNAWKFILLASYLDVALTDSSVQVPSLREIRRVVRTLRDAGFIGDGSGQVLLGVSKASYSLETAQMGALFRNEGGRPLNIFTLTPHLEKWAKSLRSKRRHILLLDGLDSIFLNDSRYDESISALVQAAHDLNLGFKQHSATGTIVLLLRNDIFSRVSSRLPDAHKMRDFAYDLDWRILSGAAGESAPLVRLINRKAGQERGGEIDFLSYFPRRIELGRSRRGRRTTPRLKYLLNLTRHTPRDMLQLLEYIRRVEEAQGRPSGGSTIADRVVREGVLQYSTKYFVDAVRGEFAGYEGGPSETEAALRALKLMEGSKFTRTDFRAAIARDTPGLEAKSDSLLKLFFYAGAVGNLFDNGGERYMVFYHRRDDVDLKTQGSLVLHNALTHAWSRKFGLR
ncbi:P-loop ATPase, Sll1717 family [Luteipulveratus halotolerans]|uniref:P-loop ATPase, Sll1717 family n=1 Tax=Luteipulveratus halotolerans TaxID=1631356 RepID=UPI0012F8DB2A|nr:hypothetical protein [Luteipulveratus halotolerans]